MGPSEKSFNQVKAILGKLDRTIDQVREKRTTPMTPPAAAASPASTPAVQPPANRPTSVYGRATPLPPRNV